MPEPDDTWEDPELTRLQEKEGAANEVVKKTRSTMTYELVEEEPEPATNRGQLFEVLESVVARGQTGDFYRVVLSDNRTGANSVLSRIRSGKSKVPEGAEFEYTCRTGDGWSKLYAKYIGPKAPEEPVAPAKRTSRR